MIRQLSIPLPSTPGALVALPRQPYPYELLSFTGAIATTPITTQATVVLSVTWAGVADVAALPMTGKTIEGVMQFTFARGASALNVVIDVGTSSYTSAALPEFLITPEMQVAVQIVDPTGNEAWTLASALIDSLE